MGFFKNFSKHEISNTVILPVLVLLLLILLVAWANLNQASLKNLPTEEIGSYKPSGAEARQTGSSPLKEQVSEVESVIRPGSNIYNVLVEAGLNPVEILRLTEKFSSSTDLTNCKPGEIITVNKCMDGSISSVLYKKGPLEVYSATRENDDWQVTRMDVPYTVKVDKVSGLVDSSLFQAMESLGEKDSLTINMTDILAWEVDFAHESRPGDKFCIIVEKYYVDDVHVGYGPILAAEYSMNGKRIRAYGLRNKNEGVDYFNEEGQSLRKTFLKSPLRYTRISSGYSRRRLHPVTKKVQPHYAIDYAAPAGTPIWAVADGIVRSIGKDRVNGRKVVMSHSGSYKTYYLHLSRFARGLKVGKRIMQKQVIGYVGSTGLATGAHLDYRLQKRGIFVNPLKENFPRAEPVEKERREEFENWITWLDSYFNDKPTQNMAALSEVK